MEFLSEKAITLWGPFAFVVILLMLGIVAVVRYFLGRQRHWDELDQKRSESFVAVAREFNDTAKDFTSSVVRMNAVIDDLKDVVSSVNDNVIKLNARRNG